MPITSVLEEGNTMKRRSLMKAAGVGTAAVAAQAVATPAIAQDMPEVRWRLTSSFPKNLDIATTVSDDFCKRVGELTSNRFQIKWFAPGEIVPALQVVDAVQNGTVEMGHSAGTYYVGKDPALAIDTALPFGTNARQQEAWIRWGGGRELLNDLYKDYNVYNLPCGNTGAQMGGWFRKEIKGVEDLKGLKFRIAGIAGQVCNKLGAVAQQIAGGDIYPALEKGTIDAAEWVGPYDDQKLGFNKIAPYYYYPGWWEGGPQTTAMIGLGKWNELPKSYQAVVEAASAYAQAWMLSKYDAQNPKALRELVTGGTKLTPFPNAVMEAAFNASTELYAELSAKSPKFKKIYDNWRPFRNEEILWFRVCEGTFDNFMARMSASDKL